LSEKCITLEIGFLAKLQAAPKATHFPHMAALPASNSLPKSESQKLTNNALCILKSVSHTHLAIWEKQFMRRNLVIAAARTFSRTYYV
jgi:hypothetical protein